MSIFNTREVSQRQDLANIHPAPVQRPTRAGDLPSYPSAGSQPPPSISRPSSGPTPSSLFIQRDPPPLLSSAATQKKKWARAPSSTPNPQPSISVPDGPVPPNFLRNQQSLLGLAGVVSGVKSAKLFTPRGSSSSTPIIIDDELNPPPLGKNPCVPTVDPNQLPTPGTEEIVTSLMKQKNIFPVLESLIRLLSPGALVPPAAPLVTPPHNSPQQYIPRHSQPASQQQPYPTHYAFYHPSQYPIAQHKPPESHVTPPPVKKRKLANVPAGATDWDIPYPFQTGEGPAAYRTNWERERGRQLVNQLMSLIKVAAHNAALKNYLQQMKVTGKSNGYAAAVRDGHNNMAANLGGGSSAGGQRTDGAATLSMEDESTTFEKWLDILQSIAPTAVKKPSTPFAPITQSRLNDNDDCMILDGPPIYPENGYIASAPDGSQFPFPLQATSADVHFALPPSTLGETNGTQASSSVHDHLIDPALWAISIPANNDHSQMHSQQPTSTSSTPDLFSPLTSASPSADPQTPRGDDQFTQPAVYNGDQDPLTAAAALLQFASTSSWLPQAAQVHSLPPVIPNNEPKHTDDRGPVIQQQPAVVGTSTSSNIRTRASKRKKEDIIRLANERRRQLITEIERAKVEFWETTIEGGVLTQLAKESS